MYPILFDKNEKDFLTNGIGVLRDAISCYVTEVRNGSYELEMQYPCNGAFAEQIVEDNIILAKPNESANHLARGAWQPFVIYKTKKTLKGIVTVCACHISYKLKYVAIPAVDYSESISAVFYKIQTEARELNLPFTLRNADSSNGKIYHQVPISARSLMGGVRGSVLDICGGEYEFRRWDVIWFNNRRGSDNDVTIRYKKNITGLELTVDYSEIYTHVLPYWRGEDDNKVEHTVVGAEAFKYPIVAYTDIRILPMDFSEEFDKMPTPEKLHEVAQEYVDSNDIHEPKINLKVNLFALHDLPEYEGLKDLETVNLCDTVHIIHEDLGIDMNSKVLSLKYDVILERNVNLEIGNDRKSLLGTIRGDKHVWR